MVSNQDQKAQLDYVANMLAELIVIAKELDTPMLIYLMEMALAEAIDTGQQENPD